MGNTLSVLDIAWLIYAHRLALGGYPFARLHPRVAMWMEKLCARTEFAKEIAMPPAAVTRLEATRRFASGGGEDTRGGGGILGALLITSSLDCWGA